MPTQQENRSNKPVRMVAVDMDGTFLNDDKTFDVERFERILTCLSRHGIYFVVASGNTYTKLRQYMHGFEHRDIIYIAENGAYVADDSGELAVHHFAAEDLPRVYEILNGMPQLGIVVCTAESSFILENREKTVMNIIRDYFEVQGKSLPQNIDPFAFASMFYPGTERISSYEQVRGVPIKFSLQVTHRDLPDATAQLRRTLPKTVTPLVSGFGAIDLVRAGVNKATGLKDLCERLQITPTQIVAFGDSDNDLEMLSLAGTGVAMAHASDELKAVSQRVIGSHNDGAVLDYLESMLDELDG